MGLTGQARQGCDCKTCVSFARSGPHVYAAGRVIASINALNQRGSTVYDAGNQSIASIDPRGYRNSMTYRLTGDLLATINPFGQHRGVQKL